MVNRVEAIHLSNPYHHQLTTPSALPTAATNNLSAEIPKAEAPRAKKAKPLVAESPKPTKRGVYVGMDKDQVLASNWGRPRKINRTENAYSVHEQWVYGGHNYLYFENGILTTIQN